MNMKRKRFYLNKIITFNSSNFNKSFFDRKIKVKTDKEKNSMEIPPSGRVSLLILSQKVTKTNDFHNDEEAVNFKTKIGRKSYVYVRVFQMRLMTL